MLRFSIIAAMDKNRGIGQGGKLPWRLRGEMEHFKTVTTKVSKPGGQNAVIMGRTTWQSLPEKFRPLPNRINLVLTRQRDLSVPAGVVLASSLNEALDILTGLGGGLGEVFVIGGASVYSEAMMHPACEKIYLTKIDSEYDCDTFFPPIDLRLFGRTEVAEPVEEDNIKYQYFIYKRNS